MTLDVPADFIIEVQDFIKTFGAKTDYTIEENNNSIILCFNNPGWSINRTSMVYTGLYNHMVKYCVETYGSGGLMEKVKVLFK